MRSLVSHFHVGLLIMTNKRLWVSICRLICPRFLSSLSTTAFLILCSAVVHPFLPISSNDGNASTQVLSDPFDLTKLLFSNGVKCSYYARTGMRGISAVKGSRRNQIRKEVVAQKLNFSLFYIRSRCSVAMR